jgi:conjugative relaxase-like TrwC/TraI family protein
MLSLGKIAAGPQAARYYTDQVALGREDYYAGEGEAPGRWVGSAAAGVGLEGRVETGQLEGLLEGAGLRRPAREGAVAGFDLTFRAPKSVSVLWGIADPVIARALGEAHDAAVDAALAYVEREACWGRRGAGGVVQVRGGGLIAAAFRHRASRDGDPLLHTHVVTGNLTQGPDDRWTALDARHLYRHAKTAGYLYQAQLRREVTERLGLSWGPVEKGTADIEGVPREAIEHFSQRRARILEHMQAHGGRSAASAQVAALETRRAKQDVDVDRLREQWSARAAEHGLDAPALEHVTQPGYRGIPIASDVAPQVLTREASTFGRPELLQALADNQPRGARISDLERVANRMLDYREVVALPEGRAPAGLTEARFTTTDMLALEQDLIDRATSSLDNGRAVVRDDAVKAAFAKRDLSAEQRIVVSALCGRGDGVAVLRAPAGTGKTHVLDAAREAWAAGRVEVVGCALSARAALELRDQAAIPSMTIAQLTGRLDEGMGLPRAGVLVVDEAGMVGTRDLARLAEAAERADAKLVLVGDDRQLPEIQAGGAFHALAERLPTTELHEVRRQHHAWDRQALDALRSGEVEQWARAYRDRGQITIGPSAPATRNALVNDWARADGDRLMIAARREDVRDLNERARQLLQHEGRLGPDELAVAGRVIGTKNDRRAGILNGQRGTVTATHPDAVSLDVVLDEGTRVQLEPEYLQAGHLDHGYAITAHRAQGATVDRTFVLGSQELYREWGYTAMSRHREQARFYVARTDLHDDRDLPPTADPIISGIGRLMQRSHAKELALDALPQADRETLELERRQIREQLATEPPPRRLPHIEQQELDRELRALENARQREHLLVENRARLKWHQRAARTANDEHLNRNLEDQSRWTTQVEQTAGTLAAGDAADRAWVAAHGPKASRLLAVDSELRTRDHLDHRADRRLQALDRNPLDRNPLDRGLPGRDFDSGLDLGP